MIHNGWNLGRFGEWMKEMVELVVGDRLGVVESGD